MAVHLDLKRRITKFDGRTARAFRLAAGMTRATRVIVALHPEA